MPRLVAFVPALFVLLWSTGFVGARYAMPHAEAFTFLAVRFALALALLVPFVLLRRDRWPRRREAMHAMLAGALIHGAYLGGVFFAIEHGLPAGIAGLIAGLQPLLTALIASAMLGERLGGRQWLGLALGLVGVALVIQPNVGNAAAAPGFAPGVLLAAGLGLIAIALGTVWQKRFVGGVDLLVGTALQYGGALVPAALGAALVGTYRIEWTTELVFALAWLTLVLSIGAVILLLFLIREGAVSRVSSLFYLVPGVTAVMAYFLFGEVLLPVQLAGLAVACLGVGAATWQGRGVSPRPTAGR